MDWWLLSFFLGALLSLFLPIVPTYFYVVLFIVLTVLTCFFQNTRRFALLILGMSWMLFHGANYHKNIENLSEELAGVANRKLEIHGIVDSIPQQKSGVVRFNFIVTKIADRHLHDKIRIRLSWQKTKHVFKLGQLWRLSIRIKPAHGLANIGGFSYQTWLRKNDIIATGYVIGKSDNKLLDDYAGIRQKLYNQLTSHLPENQLAPLLLALSFGERSKLTKAHWQILQTTNTQHLIAISGLHLGLIATMSFAVFSLLVKFAPLFRLLKPKYKEIVVDTNIQMAIVLLSCATVLFYAYLAGFSIPTLRALFMLFLYWGARMLGVKLSPIRWLLITLFLITLITPFSLFSSSFWLSFYAVSIIFLFVWRFKALTSNNKPNKSFRSKISFWLKGGFYLQCALVLLMIPISLQFNHQLSLVALPANLIAVPWMSFTSIPLSLLAVIFLPISITISEHLINLSLLSLEMLWWWLEILSGLSVASINASNLYLTVGIIIVLFFIIRVVLAVNVTRLHLFFLSLVLVSVISLTLFLQQNEKRWQLSVMDVGQGLSVIVEANNRVMVYDTGAEFPSGFSMAETVVLPYLKFRGLSTLDWLVLSHNDNDHAGGVNTLESSLSINKKLSNFGDNSQRCLSGRSFNWQFLQVQILSPDTVVGEENDDSCVLKISDGNTSVLLPGDISSKVEKHLVESHIEKSVLKSDIMVVPHHGSKTSSSKAFIKAVSPSLAIFSAGYLNRWNMPVQQVVERYKQQNIATLNTAIDGTIIVRIEPDTHSVYTYRNDIWPFWFAN